MKKKGSITIEATLILPVFLAIMGMFLFLFQVFFIQTRMESAIDLAGRKCAIYWYGVEALKDYVEQVKGDSEGRKEQEQNKDTLLAQMGTELFRDGITTLYVKNEVLKQYGQKNASYMWIKNEKKGISFLGSGISEGGTVLKIIVTYEIEIPFLPNLSFRCMQSCWKRLWTGEQYKGVDDEGQSDQDSEENENQYVYVTKNGNVYHTTVNCTYLKRTISTVTVKMISSVKNELGQSYTKCELCCNEKEVGSVYYVTTTGNKYHVTLECSSLVRYIEKRLFSEVNGLKGCSRCAQT